MGKLSYRKRKALRRKRFLWTVAVILVLIAAAFLAKNIKTRPNTAEQVKKLCRQLVKGLQTDTANLQKGVSSEMGVAEKDDIFLLATQDTTHKLDTANLQHLITGSYSLKRFNPDLQAITTIKYNLQLKPFANSKIGQYIDEYQNSLDSLKALEDIQGNYLNTDVERFVDKHFGAEGKSNDESKTLVKITSDDISQLDAEVTLIQSFKRDRILHLQKAKEKAVVLMNYVKTNFVDKQAEQKGK